MWGNDHGMPSQTERGACKGFPPALTHTKGSGHTLWKFDPLPDSPFATYVCCMECGASGSMQAWQNLAIRCPGEWTSPSTQQAWSRLNRGKHPHTRHGNRQHFHTGVLIGAPTRAPPPPPPPAHQPPVRPPARAHSATPPQLQPAQLRRQPRPRSLQPPPACTGTGANDLVQPQQLGASGRGA